MVLGLDKQPKVRQVSVEHQARGYDMSAATYTIAAYPKQVARRDGLRIVVRTVQEGDEQALLDFFLGIPEGERFFLKEDVTSPEVVRRWVTEQDYRRALALLALDGSRVVADAVLIRRRGNSRSHVGGLEGVWGRDTGTGGWGQRSSGSCATSPTTLAWRRCCSKWWRTGSRRRSGPRNGWAF